MAEKVIISRTGRTKVGIETTFGTVAGTMVDVYPESGTLFEFRRKPIKLNDERPTKFAAQKDAQGPQEWVGKLKFDLKPAGTQLNAAATAATPPQGVLAKALWGGEASGAGSTVGASATTTSVPVGTGHGSRFAVGTWVAIGVAGVLYPRKVTAIATDTLTVFPALPAGPASGQLVINSYTYYPTQSDVQSISVQLAKMNAANTSDYDQQWEGRGGTGDLSISLVMADKATMECDLRGAAWTGPSTSPSLLPASAAAETMGAPWVLGSATVLWQPIATSTAVHCPIRKLDLKFQGGMIHNEEFGGVEGRTGIERVGSDYTFVTATIEKLYDPVYEGYFTAQDSLFFAVFVPFGSGTTQRFLVLEIPTCYHTQKPQPTDSSGVVVNKHELSGLEDATITTPATDLARAPVRMAWI